MLPPVATKRKHNEGAEGSGQCKKSKAPFSLQTLKQAIGMMFGSSRPFPANSQGPPLAPLVVQVVIVVAAVSDPPCSTVSAYSSNSCSFFLYTGYVSPFGNSYFFSSFFYYDAIVKCWCDNNKRLGEPASSFLGLAILSFDCFAFSNAFLLSV